MMKNILKNTYLNLKFATQISSTARVSLNCNFGKNSVIEKRTTLTSCNIGVFSYIGNDCQMFNTEIGAYSSIGPRVTIGENEHFFDKLCTSNYLHDSAMQSEYEHLNNQITKVGSDVWIGTGAFIKKGIKIGHGAVIGAHSVVVKDIPPYAVVVGVPAKIIKYRFDIDLINQLLEIKWWEKDVKTIMNNNTLFFGDDLQESISLIGKL